MSYYWEVGDYRMMYRCPCGQQSSFAPKEICRKCGEFKWQQQKMRLTVTREVPMWVWAIPVIRFFVADKTEWLPVATPRGGG